MTDFYDELRDENAMLSALNDAHAAQWPATWHICGHSPDALFVEVRPRTGQRDSVTVKAVLDVMASVPGANPRLESEQHPAPYHCYGMWRWGEGWIATDDPYGPDLFGGRG